MSVTHQENDSCARSERGSILRGSGGCGIHWRDLRLFLDLMENPALQEDVSKQPCPLAEKEGQQSLRHEGRSEPIGERLSGAIVGCPHANVNEEISSNVSGEVHIGVYRCKIIRWRGRNGLQIRGDAPSVSGRD